MTSRTVGRGGDLAEERAGRYNIIFHPRSLAIYIFPIPGDGPARVN